MTIGINTEEAPQHVLEALSRLEMDGVLELTSLNFPFRGAFLKRLEQQGYEVVVSKEAGEQYPDHIFRVTNTDGYPKSLAELMIPYLKASTQDAHIVQIRRTVNTRPLAFAEAVVNSTVRLSLESDETVLANQLPMILEHVEKAHTRTAAVIAGALMYLRRASSPYAPDDLFYQYPDTVEKLRFSLQQLQQEAWDHKEVRETLENFILNLAQCPDHPARDLFIMALNARLMYRARFVNLHLILSRLPQGEFREHILAWLMQRDDTYIQEVIESLESMDGDEASVAQEAADEITERFLSDQTDHSMTGEDKEDMETDQRSPYEVWKDVEAHLDESSDSGKIAWVLRAFGKGTTLEWQLECLERLATLEFEDPSALIRDVFNKRRDHIRSDALPSLAQLLVKTSPDHLKLLNERLFLRMMSNRRAFSQFSWGDLSESQKLSYLRIGSGSEISMGDDTYSLPGVSAEQQASVLFEALADDSFDKHAFLHYLTTPFHFQSQESFGIVIEAVCSDQQLFDQLNESAFERMEAVRAQDAISGVMGLVEQVKAQFISRCEQFIKDHGVVPAVFLQYCMVSGADVFSHRIERLTRSYDQAFPDTLRFATDTYDSLELLFENATNGLRMQRVSTHLDTTSFDDTLYGFVFWMACSSVDNAAQHFESAMNTQSHWLPELFAALTSEPDALSEHVILQESSPADTHQAQEQYVHTEEFVSCTLETISEIADLPDHTDTGRPYRVCLEGGWKGQDVWGSPSEIKAVPASIRSLETFQDRLADEWEGTDVMVDASLEGDDILRFPSNLEIFLMKDGQGTLTLREKQYQALLAARDTLRSDKPFELDLYGKVPVRLIDLDGQMVIEVNLDDDRKFQDTFTSLQEEQVVLKDRLISAQEKVQQVIAVAEDNASVTQDKSGSAMLAKAREEYEELEIQSEELSNSIRDLRMKQQHRVMDRFVQFESSLLRSIPSFEHLKTIFPISVRFRDERISLEYFADQKKALLPVLRREVRESHPLTALQDRAKKIGLQITVKHGKRSRRTFTEQFYSAADQLELIVPKDSPVPFVSDGNSSADQVLISGRMQEFLEDFEPLETDLRRVLEQPELSFMDQDLPMELRKERIGGRFFWSLSLPASLLYKASLSKYEFDFEPFEHRVKILGVSEHDEESKRMIPNFSDYDRLVSKSWVKEHTPSAVREALEKEFGEPKEEEQQPRSFLDRLGGFFGRG